MQNKAVLDKTDPQAGSLAQVKRGLFLIRRLRDLNVLLKISFFECYSIIPNPIQPRVISDGQRYATRIRVQN